MLVPGPENMKLKLYFLLFCTILNTNTQEEKVSIFKTARKWIAQQNFTSDM